MRTALLLAPLVVVLGGLFGGALALAVAQSLGFAPWFGVRAFPDPSHFAALWGSGAFWASLGLTLGYAGAATLGALALGTALALALGRAFRGRGAARAALRVPLVVPYTVGIALAVVMLGNGGVLARAGAALGLLADPGDFPRILHTHAGWGVIAVYVWKQAPFVMLVVGAGLAGMGRETREAAATLGAGPWTTFRLVTLPQIVPALTTAALISLAFNVGAFEAPFILGGGHPDTLPVLAWRDFNDADYTRQLRGMAAVVSLVIVAGAILGVWLLLYRRWERRVGRA